MAISINPLGNRLVVQPIEEEEITSGGIVLPGSGSGSWRTQ